MVGPVIFAEKLRRPDPSGLGRPRLENPLLDLSSRSRLDVVVGPPGSGKSTLLARVAAAWKFPVAWYRLTADDGAEPVMVGHLARALGDALSVPVPCTDLHDLLASLQRPDVGPAMVIFDDVHEIAGSAAEHALEQFVALRPQAVRVVLGSRRLPNLNVPRLRVSGLLREFSGDDLRFRSWEVEELFITVFREPLSPEAAASLTRRIDGWAAGLQLFHLATRGRSAADRQRAVAELSGRSRLVRSYLARNVIAELPDERRQFLLRTSTLGVLTGALCDDLLDATGSGRVLDELEQHQLFTSSDDDGATFRYHEVMRAHLEWALVEEFGIAEARRWYSRSARLLEASGHVTEAIRACVKAEDWGAVARLHQQRGPKGGAGPSLDVLPSSVVQDDPWLSLADARRRMRNGALADAGVAYSRAELLLDEPAFRECCRRERAAAQIWTPGAVSWPGDTYVTVDHWSTPIRAATRGVQASGPVGSPEGPLGELALGAAALLVGDLTRARALLPGIGEKLVDPTGSLLARLAIAVLDIVSGGVLTVRAEASDASTGSDAAGDLRQICMEADYAGLPWVERLSRGLAEAVLAAPGAPSWRVDACLDIVSECDRAGDPWGAAILRLAAAVAHQINDEADPDDFRDAARRFRALDAPVPARWAEVLEVCARASTGEPGVDVLARRVADAAAAAQLPEAAAVADALADALVNRGTAARSAWVRAVVAHFLPSFVVMPARRAPATVLVRCFGGFSLDIDGGPADLSGLRPRARAVLRMLAVAAGTDVHQEYLIEAFWPGTPVTVALRRLQVAISSIRQRLEQLGLGGVEWLPRHENAYRLQPGIGGTVDLRLFDEHLRLAGGDRDVERRISHREAALALYGELLPEDGPAEHVVAERERCRLAAAGAAAALARDLRGVGRADQALAAAARSVQLERYQDAAWDLLVALYEDSGDALAADRVRHEHAETQLDWATRE